MVKNVGDVSGDEVVQIYVHDKKSSLDRPVKELKAFKRISLAAGEEKNLSFSLDKRAFSYFDPKQGWVVEPGEFTIMAGSSSDDVRLSKNVYYK